MNFNDTQSSVRTFNYDEGRMFGGSSTINSVDNKYEPSIGKTQLIRNPVQQNQTINPISNRHFDQTSQSISYMPSELKQSSQSYNYPTQQQPGTMKGYTPESHNQKPRHIQTTEVKQRLSSDQIIADPIMSSSFQNNSSYKDEMSRGQVYGLQVRQVGSTGPSS